MAMSEKTAKVYAAIREEAERGNQSIVANIFSHCYGRANTSAAFRQALKDGIIEKHAVGGFGNPIYRGVVTKAVLN